jgi:pyruvate dehydrogenase E1 component alpha subunit
LHLYIGEEAIAVGVMESLRDDDAVVATYREHGHALVKGMSMNCLMAEMYGKMSGCSRGRGGSMHLFSKKHRLYGGNAIVGGGIPLATGLALADKMQGRDRVTVCFFGEGAVAEGEFHESMNLAELWNLPVLFCCENNLYAMGTALDRSESQPDIHLKAASYGMHSSQVDGMNVREVEKAAKSAVDAVRRGEGPRFIELRTFRYRAHSMFDAELYRTKTEVQQWRERDPLANYLDYLEREDLVDDDELARIEQEVIEEVEQAVEYAENADWEPVEELTRFVYSEEKE